MIIHYCSEIDAIEWDDFLINQENSSFYHLFSWKQINEKCFGHKCYYLAAKNNGNISGVLPLVYINSFLFGKILCSMPFVNYGGLCALNAEAEEHLLSEAENIVRKAGADYLELRSSQRIGTNLPTSEHKVSMTLDLSPDVEDIWKSFKSKQRTEIRRACKNELEVISGGKELLDMFYATIINSWRSLGVPIYQKCYFESILDAFPYMTKVFVVMHQGKPIASAFNGYYNGIVEGMWLGIIPQFKRLQPNTVLYWEMIKHACENNMETFHFGRSSVDSGGEFFKKKWNAQQKQLFWQYQLGKVKTIPQLNVQNPKYSIAMNIWKKLPLTLTTFIGPHLAKSIP